jgi:hypothetical protein
MGDYDITNKAHQIRGERQSNAAAVNRHVIVDQERSQQLRRSVSDFAWKQSYFQAMSPPPGRSYVKRLDARELLGS